MRLARTIRPSLIAKGAPWLKTTLVQCAWAAVKEKQLSAAQFYRIKARRGPNKAIMGSTYQQKSLIRRLADLGIAWVIAVATARLSYR